MLVLSDLLGTIYILVLVALALYGFNSMATSILFLFTRKRMQHEPVPPLPQHWPSVTIQLPVFNEKYTLERLLWAVTRLDYPVEHLQIQILDDSTDDTSSLTASLVNEYQARGLNVEWIHRENRAGYKAGALERGLTSARGELIAIFDADFVPEPNWLKQTVPYFQNPKLGCLQTRWGHTNRDYNSLTRAQALAIDGHFVVEQTVRSRNGFFLNFNGTAGLWRRACIEDAGGWQADTLTEDLDLSYRAQLRGWRIEYLPDVVVPAELPAYVEAFKKQQFRWAKGTFQVVRKLLPRIFEEPDLPWYARLMAFFHLTGYFVHPLMVAMLLLTLPVGLIAPQFFHLLPFSAVATFGPPMLYALAGARLTPSFWERLKLLPLLTIMGFGISLSTAIAVVEGMAGVRGTFVRTPKLNLGNRSKTSVAIDQTYLPPVSPLVWGEMGLGVYALLTIFFLEPHRGWEIIPWMLVYWLGYFYIASMNLFQHWQSQPTRQSIRLHQQA